jgi:hypothetical protein
VEEAAAEALVDGTQVGALAITMHLPRTQNRNQPTTQPHPRPLGGLDSGLVWPLAALLDMQLVDVVVGAPPVGQPTQTTVGVVGVMGNRRPLNQDDQGPRVKPMKALGSALPAAGDPFS